MKNRPFRSTFANMGGGTNHNPKRGRSFLFELLDNRVDKHELDTMPFQIRSDFEGTAGMRPLGMINFSG